MADENRWQDIETAKAVGTLQAEPEDVSALRAAIPDAVSHGQAIRAICDCAATVTALSYQEAIEAYLTLRGLQQ